MRAVMVLALLVATGLHAAPTRRQCRSACVTQLAACVDHTGCKRNWMSACRRAGVRVCRTGGKPFRIPRDGRADRWDEANCPELVALSTVPHDVAIWCFRFHHGTGYGI